MNPSPTGRRRRTSRPSASPAPRRLPFRPIAATALAALTALALVGCVSSGRPSASAPEPDPTRTASAPKPDPTRTVPAPGGGTVDQQIPAPAPAPTVDTALGARAEVDSGVSIRVVSVTPTTVKASTPGEVSGAAVRVAVVVTNAGKAATNVDSAWVQLTASDGTFGVGTSGGDPTPLSGELPPGSSASGDYVFMLPRPRGRSVTVTISYSAGAPVARFEGSVT
ncbi:MAG: hypothetical protein HY996_10790 [Micrococcales bacterium]|nr:hypothetical protein [Micrococcales bacterium]